MSGHSSFAPIGNNIPRPAVNNVQPVDANTIANTTNVQQPGNVEVPAEKPPRASDLVGQLDVLLLKATDNAAKGVNKAHVKAVAEKALPSGVAKRIATLAGKAQDRIADLDKFTGRQLAAAMSKNAGGEIVWEAGNAAAKAFKAAVTAQQDLSSAIAEVLGSAKDFKTQCALEEVMLQCDRRVAELETLVIQMSEIVDKGGENAQEQASALAGDKMISFTSRDSLDKFDRGSALAAMKAEIKPLADRLARYAAGGRSLTEEEVASCTSELNALKDKFSAAATSGSIKAGDKTVFCDRSMLAEASKLLGKVGEKINSMHRDIIKGAMSQLVEKSFPFLKDEIFEERFAQDLARLSTEDGDTGARLSQFVSMMNALRNSARAFVESPTPANKGRLMGAAAVLEDMDRLGAAATLANGFFSEAVPGRNASAAFKAALAKFKAKIAGNGGAKFIEDLSKTVSRSFSGVTVAANKLAELSEKLDAGPGSKVYVSSWVLGAFRGEQTVSSIVEARAHGYDDSDIDPQIDDSNVVSSRELGSGAFNTVTILTLKDGSEWVFKPEMPASLTASYSSHFHGMAKNMEFTRINLAVNDTANTLGLNDVMVTTKAGTHKGRFGMFMAKAPGTTMAGFTSAKKDKLGEDKLSLSELRKLDDAKFGTVVGRMMRQANRLMWFDVITAQGDRHNSNYLISIDRKSLDVTIKGIDNDASYGLMRTGLKTFSLPAGSAALKVFSKYLSDTARNSTDPQEYLNQIMKDPGVRVHSDKSIEIDIDQVRNKQFFQGILHFCGLRNVAIPEEMDKELYDKLVALAKDAPDGGAARTAYLDSLATRLGANSKQYEYAVKRLDEAIAHARKLDSEGKVYSAEQWETRDVQKSIARKSRTPAKNSTYLPPSKKSGQMKMKSAYTGNTNLIVRDLYSELTEHGKHKDWFK